MSTRLYNQTTHKFLRRVLRKTMPRGEYLVWQELKASKTGLKFRRQVSIDKIVVDFYYPQAKIAIEIDGLTHSTEAKQLKDRKRDLYLRSIGVRVLRYSSSQVFYELESVIFDIVEKCKKNIRAGE